MPGKCERQDLKRPDIGRPVAAHRHDRQGVIRSHSCSLSLCHRHLYTSTKLPTSRAVCGRPRRKVAVRHRRWVVPLHRHGLQWCLLTVKRSLMTRLETLARRVNPLKDLIRVAQQNPHLVSLANGDPHFSLYPVRRINIEIASVSSSDDPVSTWRTLGPSAPTQTLASVIDEDSGPLLRASLAYGHGAGLHTVAEQDQVELSISNSR
ncbi:hypothetical protein BD310DRAFT_411639 [Dichomitus squalens]|uniref:Uncharacterized protein n=1 Tax=Dichomitus squalens TaxID=114155 RepID=A0A4Q9P9P3_9APHY|nr:hypothetical protein BD310DRAFT_411639 [Dichomitus squalens]